MQDLQDSQFSAHIANALKSETTLTREQQQRAWEALRAKVSQQTMLPARKPSHFERLRSAAHTWVKLFSVHLYHLFLDDSRYRRVQPHYPLIMRHQRPHSTCAAAEFMLLA